MSFLTSFSQNTVEDTNNSSTANVNAGVTFVGKATPATGIAGIQVSLKMDKNGLIYIEQSPGLGTGTGTVITTGTISLSGAGTDFLNRSVGDEIYVSGETVRTIATIVSDTSLTVTEAFSTTASGLSYQYYNWDITDTYDYWASINNFGITVQAINSYLRIRVKNNSTSNTTYFRLQTVLCPIIEAVPRSLDESGHFKTSIKSINDHYGFEVENTPMGEMRTITPTRLVGAAFEGTTIDTNFWTATTSNATISQANNQIALSTTIGQSAASAVFYSLRRARYSSGASMRFRANIQLGDTGTANNTRIWGIAYGTTMPTITDGVYFRLNGTTFQIVRLKGASVAAPTEVISSGSFNGNIGATYAPTTDNSTYEIYWTNSKVYFIVNDELLHTISATTSTWSSTMSHHIYMSNVNSGNTDVVNMYCRNASIYRLGPALTQPTSYYHALGTTAGVQLKQSPGNLHSVTILNIGTAGGVITLSDSTSTSTPVILAHTTVATSNLPGTQTPVTIPCHGLPFHTGLRLTVATQNVAALIVYE